MHISPLTNAEEQLMQLFWKMETFHMKDVLENHPEPKPHQNTISTYLKILVEKKFLKTEKEGRIFLYSIAIPYENYRVFVIKNLIENYFDGSSSDLLKTLMEEKLLKSSELSQFFEVKTTVIPVKEDEKPKEKSDIAEFIKEITDSKKEKKKKKKEKKKKNK